jgi:hypothetical protein
MFRGVRVSIASIAGSWVGNPHRADDLLCGLVTRT